jgi:hypothetical protein
MSELTDTLHMTALRTAVPIFDDLPLEVQGMIEAASDVVVEARHRSREVSAGLDLITSSLSSLQATHSSAALAGAALVVGLATLGVIAARGGSLSVSYAGANVTLNSPR